jgi:hypothetical protein
MSQHTLVQAVELWKASAPFLKKLIDNHRSAVAQKMKTDILTGKYNIYPPTVPIVSQCRSDSSTHLIGLKYLHSRSGDGADDTGFFKDNPIYNKEVLDGLEILFQQFVLSEDPTKIAKVRIENIHAFNAFTVLCLRHTVGNLTWKLKHRRVKISDFMTVSDETLALLILENNAKIWKNKAYGIPCVNTFPKYMKTTKEGRARKEWSKEGKARFNTVFHQLKELRSFTASRSNELELLRLWNSSTTRRSSRNDRLEHSPADDGDESDDEIIVVYET